MDNSKPSADFAVHSNVNQQLGAELTSQTYNKAVGGTDLEPHAVKGRSASPLEGLSDLVSLSVSVPTGSSAIFTSTLTSSNGEIVKQLVSSQFYIGSVATANRVPEVLSSASYATQEWSALYNAAGVSIVDLPGVDIYCRQIRNASGATKTICVEAVVRYMVNRTNNAALSTSFVVAP